MQECLGIDLIQEFEFLINIGEVDSSGFNFFYVSTPRKEDAGILFFGHDVQWNMLIPPKADDYKIVGMCAAGCTREVL